MQGQSLYLMSYKSLDTELSPTRSLDDTKSGQRSRHGTSGHSTRDIKNRTHIDSPRNFYNAPDQLVPVDE